MAPDVRPSAQVGRALLSWSDTVDPDNPHRRERVTELANKLRSNVEQLYTVCLSMSLVVHQAHLDFNVIPPIDLTKTYNENFEAMREIFKQWASISENLKDGEEVTDEARKLIDDINSATDANAFTKHVGKVIVKVSDAAFWTRFTIILIVGAVASKFAYTLIVSGVGGGMVGIALSAIRGAVAGAGVAVIVDIIIGAIDGARERGELEARAAELQEAIDKLALEVTNLQLEITGIMVKIVQLQTKSQK